MNHIFSTMQAASVATLHIAGMSLPRALAQYMDKKEFRSLCSNDYQKKLLNHGLISKTSTLDEAFAALKQAREAEFDYLPVTEKIISYGLISRTDPFLAPGLFISTPDNAFYGHIGRRRVVAFAGTRNSTDYGAEMTRRIVSSFDRENTIIATGFSYGTQRNVIEAALKNKIPVIAVMATGAGAIYPKAAESLFEKIRTTSGCAVITPFLPDAEPAPRNFLVKNHYLAGAATLYVPESATRGGAMVAARLCHSNRGIVYAVPGRIGDCYSAGCNRLIEEGTARMYIPED